MEQNSTKLMYNTQSEYFIAKYDSTNSIKEDIKHSSIKMNNCDQ